MKSPWASEADRVRGTLADDPFLSNEDYGRLVAEATQADDAAALKREVEPPESVIWAPRFAEARNYLLDAAAALTEDNLDPEDALHCARHAIERIERLIAGD